MLARDNALPSKIKNSYSQIEGEVEEKGGHIEGGQSFLASGSGSGKRKKTLQFGREGEMDKKIRLVRSGEG